MVSKHWLAAITFTTAQWILAATPQTTASQTPVPQPSPAPSSFRPDSSPAPAPTKPVTLVSPEMRGDIFMARKMYREAAEAYREAPQDNAVILNKTGIAYHQMLDLDTAKKYYERAVKVNAQYAEAVNNLGTIYYAKKSYRRAVNQYKKALRLTPNSASIYSNLGTGYFARKDYKLATEAWQQALVLDPDVFENRSTRGVLLQEKSVEERAKFHYYMAKMYAKSGSNDRALLYIRKALEEGFKEKKKFEEEPEFAALKDLPEFKELLAMEPRVL
jgi:tetratricopeptide (TPR) repeat protein